MNLIDAISPAFLLLGRMVCKKIADTINGIVSVGVATLELASPTEFLTDQKKIVAGFLDILRSIGVQPGHADKIELLQQRIDRLSELADLFHHRFLQLADWRVVSAEGLRDAADRFSTAYAELLEALGAFSSLLGQDLDYSAKAQQGRTRVEEFVGIGEWGSQWTVGRDLSSAKPPV